MFTASPAEIVVAGLALGSVVAWLDSLTNPPAPDDVTAWWRRPEPAQAKETLALPAPSIVVPQPLPVQPAPVASQDNIPAPAPKPAVAAMSSNNATRVGPKGKGRK
jgi:hypothetical protein